MTFIVRREIIVNHAGGGEASAGIPETKTTPFAPNRATGGGTAHVETERRATEFWPDAWKKWPTAARSPWFCRMFTRRKSIRRAREQHRRRYDYKCCSRGKTQIDQLGQVWGHTPQQRFAMSSLRRYSFGLRLAIAGRRQSHHAHIHRIGLHLTQPWSMRAAFRHAAIPWIPTRQNPRTRPSVGSRATMP